MSAPTEDARHRCRAAAEELRELASRAGLPEVLHTTAATLPGASAGHVVYDLGVAVCLALGDLAEAVEDLAAADTDAVGGDR